MNPNDIKVDLTDAEKQDIIIWLDSQISDALTGRSEQEQKWSDWVDQYEEKMKPKTFPWKNCANVFIPLTSIAVETIHAREVNTILGIKPYVQCRAKTKIVEADDVTNIERFLDEILRVTIDGYDTISQWLLEKEKMGDSFIKVGWAFDSVKLKTSAGTKEIKKDDVDVQQTSIDDLIFPTNATSVESPPWVGHRFRSHWNVLQRKEKLGIYENIDKIKAFYKQNNDNQDASVDHEANRQELEGIQERSPEKLETYELIEVHFDWDVDNDGIAERVVATIERKSLTMLRLIYFPYAHGRRPFIQNRYIKRTNRIYSKGISEMSSNLQEAINTVFNQTIDNATLANIKCFKGRKGAKRDIGEVYPGKTFWLDDISDLEEFSLGDVHQSSFILHNLLKDYHERRTKVTDLNSGRPSDVQKSRATATGTLALLQESGRHFDLILNNTREAITELAYQIIELYLQYKPSKVIEVTGDDGNFEDLELPDVGSLRDEYAFSCAATSVAVNKEIEKQANMVLIQQLSGVFRQVLQLLMTVATPQANLPEDIKKYVYDMIKSYHQMAEDIVRSFEKVDIKSYIPELPETVRQALDNPEGALGQEDLVAQIGGLLEQFGGGEEPTNGLGE